MAWTKDNKFDRNLTKRPVTVVRVRPFRNQHNGQRLSWLRRFKVCILPDDQSSGAAAWFGWVKGTDNDLRILRGGVDVLLDRERSDSVESLGKMNSTVDVVKNCERASRILRKSHRDLFLLSPKIAT